MPVPVALLSPEAKAHFKVKADHGVVALNVRPGSPAATAGLANGDVLLKYAGQDVPDTKGLDPTKPESGEAFGAAFAKIAGTTRPGKEIEVVVERDGKPVTLKAVPVDLATAQKFAGEEEDEDDEKNEGAEGPEKGEGPEKAPEKAPASK
jgi:Protease degQ (EC 3.4.21.-)